MAGFTPYYSVAYFDFGDRLSAEINVQREIDRFVFIDKQIYGLYQVFGDGVISGWDVADNGFSTENGLSISISPGMGVIKSIACNTDFPEYIINVPSNSTLEIYAILNGNTVSDRDVDFILHTPATDLSSSVVKIASIITGDSSIISIDNTDRTLISFVQEIQDAIDIHRHRGTPSKIDLESEVKNQLPGSKIDGFDVSKIISGKLSTDRFPLLDHSNLDNIGNLTHAQLETLIQDVTPDNSILLGEISTINLLKQIIFLKTKYNDVDKYFINELVISPGVSLNSYIDFEASTAYIDTSEGCIIGLPTIGEETFFFTNNFFLPDRLKNIFLTSHSSTPPGSQIIFGINTNNSIDFNNYETITENKISSIVGTGTNLRVGVKFITGEIPPNPYAVSFIDIIEFIFVNEATTKRFHFRIRFYNDENLTDLYLTEFSGNSQENWLVNNTLPIPSCGYEVIAGTSISVSFFPVLSKFFANKPYYIVIDTYDGTAFVSQSGTYMFMATGGSTFCSQYGDKPQLKNFALFFELDNNKKIILNL
jgi:hypothetical protein